ncbi:hypothetical protein BGZ65_010510, partial [Modicella reniformis]
MPQSWLNIFDIKSNSWSSSNPPALRDTTRRDFYAVTNPDKNEIYIVGGNAGPQGAVAANVLDTFDVASKSMTETPIPSSGPQNAYTYTAAWIKHLSSMVLIGGQVTGGYLQSLSVYNSKTGAWSTQ